MEENKQEEKIKTVQRHPILFWVCVAIEGIAALISMDLAIREQINFIFVLLKMQVIVVPAILGFIGLFLLLIKPKNDRKVYRRHPVVFWGCVAIEGITVLISAAQGVRDQFNFVSVLLMMQLLAVPVILSFINIALIFIKPEDDRKWKRKARAFEMVATIIGLGMSGLAFTIFARLADWHVQIAVSENHSPVWIRSIPTVVGLCLVGVAGYLILAFTHAKKTPPLLTVLAISAVYIGVFECVIWSIQVYKEAVLLIILPVNCIIIAARLIREKALELKAEGENVSKQSGPAGWINRELGSGRFPIWALVLAFPLLGAVIGLLVLFGQRPDDIIKSYTETADWTLSQQIAPPGYADHYLCTVAAQGHVKLVKPQREGIRRGRKIVVNRQLCIANAFEQILEECTPRLHKAVRKFYDTHGFPIAQLIKTKAAADFTYIVMKPLEWFFLIVLYLFTANPEERISRQYTK